jgi:hypothetical protein
MNKTKNNKMIVRTTAAVLVAGVATMLAAGSASAATPRVAPHAPAAAARVTGGQVGFRSIELVNMTPYEWTLDPASVYVDTDANTRFNAANWPVQGAAPIQTLEPGQREDISTQYNNGKYGVMWVNYNFTDAAGGQHMETFQTPSSPFQWGENVAINAADGNDSSAVHSTTFNTVKYNPDSDPVTVAAGMNGPTDVTVDAKQEPARAAAIMQEFPDGTNQSYTPTTEVGFTTYTDDTPAEKVTGEFINGSSEKASITLTHSLQTSQSTTLGVEVGADAEFNILGLVSGDASVSVQTSKSFGADSTVSGSTGLVLQPAGSTTGRSNGWITRKSDTATVTGDFDFTTGGGLIIYHVKNVTVNATAVTDPTKPTSYAVVYGQEWDSKTPTVPAG